MTLYEPPSSESQSISVRSLLDDRGLGMKLRLVAGEGGLGRLVKHPRIQKSGLALIGHSHGLVPARVQVLGETELSFTDSLDSDGQRLAASHFFILRPACVLVTRGVEVPEPFVEAADRTQTPLLVCEERTSQAITKLHTLLDDRLAPRTRIHGVLVDIFEVGVFLRGKSGIGKSEAALELVMRGHRLVADDAVECDYRPPGMVFGSAAPLLRHHIEVRGLGILDISELYGVTAIRDRKRIDLIVHLEHQEDVVFDRIGLEQRTHEILGVPIREVLLPVRPGRNMSAIIEIAARHELLRQAGRDPAKEFIDRVDSALAAPTNESGSYAAVPAVVRTRPAPPPETRSSEHSRKYESGVPPSVTSEEDD